MPVKIEKYVGRNAEIIYQDSKGQFTKRRVTVYSVRDGRVKVLDWDKRSFRTLHASRILAALPVMSRAAG